MKNILFYFLALDIGVIIGKFNFTGIFTYHLVLFN